MDPPDAEPNGAAEAAASALADELQSLDSASHHSASIEPGELSARRASISSTPSLDGSSRGNEVPCINIPGDHNVEHNPWEGPEGTSSATPQDEDNPATSDVMKYGMEGLLEALKKYPSTHPPIVSQDGVNEELLRHRLLES
ncbi:hypothetical protein, conserved [Babesia bigemina]|uniref:Uncharacterized protein n=1 Tax=Babesia bigemina TaxID=5866 RepID=A0A061D4P7_BABBI|nr:hypothetical protein, conserved [Babesia bigemina]CDR95022.1 hypothetical protein, conserved [Babesia bigemina]|eukprot:XP_012767208.1 hypothetical protein, conserved [Babesia bigemina]